MTKMMKPQTLLLKSKDFMNWVYNTVDRTLEITYVKSTVNKIATPIFNWAQRNSLYPLHFGIACCALEIPAVVASSRFDSERFGVIYRSSPRQCDVLLVAGPVTKKLKSRLRRLYEQMPEPKWVIAVGECAISGGPFYESYNIVEGCDKIIPVDIYIPGCPPRPEAFLDAILKLQRKIKKEQKGLFEIK
jgi:NADH-quinone oxidoreductase subunit B